jgi:hypothetical protein
MVREERFSMGWLDLLKALFQYAPEDITKKKLRKNSQNKPDNQNQTWTF